MPKRKHRLAIKSTTNATITFLMVTLLLNISFAVGLYLGHRDLKYHEIHSEITKLKEHVRHIEKEDQQVRANYTNLEKILQNRSDEVAQLNETTNNRLAEIKVDLNSKITKLQEHISYIEKDNQQLRANYTNFEKILQNRSSEVDQLKETMNNTVTEIKVVRERYQIQKKRNKGAGH